MTKQEAALEFTYTGTFPDPALVENIIEQPSDIAVHIDADGVVLGIYVNPENPSFGSLEHWVGRLFEGFLTEESQAKFGRRLSEIRSSGGRALRSIELNHTDNAAWEFPVRYTPLMVQDSGALLLIGRDLQPIAEVQQRLVSEQLQRERDQQKLRSAETHYRLVLEAALTPLVVVDPETARIRELNSAAADLLGAAPETLRGNALNQSFDKFRRGELMEALQAAAETDGGVVEVIARRSGKALSVLPRFFRAAGELGLLCRLVPFAGESKDASGIAQDLQSLFRNTSDAIVTLDGNGFVCEANEAFLILADAAQLRDVRGRSFSDFLLRGEVDLKLLLDGARKSGAMRSYAAQFRSTVGTRAGVDISAAVLRPRKGEAEFGLIVRDAPESEATGDAASNVMVSEDAIKSVMDLVGTASLKELVSATSDVIERMCIETALQLTNNNRVASAEMLGLSRQSLYVKLRKYGMVSDGKSD
ncbi:transcriptional regulator PpsR [Lutimaribacter marinistellae]|uniref:Transcriptional regulator PpsR n=1 Tax=Lutimaribacter marinistellae TaxID=1820329 RepID=A0ABV7TH38_9RHOB